MSEQYRVDLSELEAVMSKLNTVLSGLGKANSCAKSDTYLPTGALGSAFSEADDLARSHTEMKTNIEDIMDHLEYVMDQFGKNTKTAHGAYQNSEFETQAGMSQTGKS